MYSHAIPNCSSAQINKFSHRFQMCLTAKVGPRSIHSKDSIEFMRKLVPDSSVLDIMENGLKFNFTEEPSEYHEDNNLSLKNNLEVAQNKVDEWLKCGLITQVQSRPYCCSPLSVSEKIDYQTGKRKKRPCLDLSRHINKYLVSPR